MKLGKRDGIFIGLMVVVLAAFIAISGKEKTKPVPLDAAHKPVYDEAFKNAPGPDASFMKKMFFKPAKKDAEKLCEPCHQQNNIKLPPNHPPKYRCLFCHKLIKQ